MKIERKNILKAIKEAKARAKKRNFVESIDLAVNFQGIDFKRPENRIEVRVVLPHGRGKPVKIALFADKALAAEMKKEENKGIVDAVITKEEIEAANKKTAKKWAQTYDFFIAEAPLMPLIGKKLGPILGPRKKMPTPVPPNVEAIKRIAAQLRKTVIVSNKKGKYMPVVHCAVGTVEMPEEQVADNAMAVINALLQKVKPHNIKSIYVKTTMGPAVKVEG